MSCYSPYYRYVYYSRSYLYLKTKEHIWAIFILAHCTATIRDTSKVNNLFQTACTRLYLPQELKNFPTKSKSIFLLKTLTSSLIEIRPLHLNRAILKYAVFRLLVFLKFTFLAQRSKILNIYTNWIFNASIIGLFS